jgi:peroxiredoxin
MSEPVVPPPPPKQSLTRVIVGWVARFVLFAIIFLAVSRWQQRDHVPDGTPAPSFSLRTLDGKQVSLEEFRGKPVLLHFWATWCGVCRQEFSMLNSLHESLGSDAVLLSVVADSDTPGLGAFASEQGIQYPVLLGNAGMLSAYKVGAFPTNYFIAPDGSIASSSVGMSTQWASRARLSCAR